MGSGVSAEALKNASAQEVKQVVADLPPESKQKLEEALTKTEKTSLVSSAPQTVATEDTRSLIEKLAGGVKMVENFMQNAEVFTNMFGQFDQDGSGKVKVSELGPMADSIIRAVDGVDSKEELMKTFDKNGDGEINKEEWKELITEFFKAMQQKTAKQLIDNTEKDAELSADPAWPELKATLEKYV